MSENKGDLISREVALQELSGLCESWEDDGCTSYQALDIVGNLPAVDAQPVVHGHWTQSKWPESVAGYDDRCWICSACGNAQGYGECPYCPDCGAKMDGGSK